jgi:hypothetical protein
MRAWFWALAEKSYFRDWKSESTTEVMETSHDGHGEGV